MLIFNKTYNNCQQHCNSYRPVISKQVSFESSHEQLHIVWENFLEDMVKFQDFGVYGNHLSVFSALRKLCKYGLTEHTICSNLRNYLICHKVQQTAQ